MDSFFIIGFVVFFLVYLASEFYSVTLIQKLIFLDTGTKIPRRGQRLFYHDVNEYLRGDQKKKGFFDKTIYNPNSLMYDNREAVSRTKMRIGEHFVGFAGFGRLLTIPIVGTAVLYCMVKKMKQLPADKTHE